ncbi:MAG: hypothetical protein ACRCZF_12480 [Gemmataceae bacterium]
MKKITAILALLLATIAGCGESAEMKKDPVAFTFKATFNGKPVTDVGVQFAPSSAKQSQGMFNLDSAGNIVKGGTGEPKLIPGKYVVFFIPADIKNTKGPAAYKAIPEKYKEVGTSGLEVEILPTGGEVTVTVVP